MGTRFHRWILFKPLGLVSVALITAACSSQLPLSESVQIAKVFEIPKQKIGYGLKEWINHLGEGYRFNKVQVRKARHSNAPVAWFVLSIDVTEVLLAVDIESNRHMLNRVVSKDPKFIRYLDLDSLPKTDPEQNEWRWCWDSGCNVLLVTANNAGEKQVTMTYGWD